MEVSGVVSRCLSGAGLDSLVGFSGCDGDYSKPKKVSCAMRSSRKVCRLSNSGFSDKGHLHYYVSPKAGLKENNNKVSSLKKKLKLVKGMSKDLLRFSSMGFGEEIKGMNISEATEILLSQLKQLKAEEKELKTKRKQEKAILKASGASSSSSSESSDDETRDSVIDMASLTSAAPKPIEPQVEFQTQRTSPISTPPGGEISLTIGDKIEVCTGGKCNKSGATALIKEFQQRLGGEDAVVGCKCMGKCKEGPNVRVITQSNQTNPLCLGVALDDVGTIVSTFFGEGRKHLGLMVV